MGIVHHPSAIESQAVPLPALPVEQQVRRDLRISNIAVGCFAAGLGFGLIYLAAQIWSTGGAKDISYFVIGLSIVFIVGGYFLLTFRRATATVLTENEPDLQADPRILDYRSPRTKPRVPTAVKTISALSIGFIAGLLVAVGIIALIFLSICGGMLKGL
jgi:hypothetical protein